MLYFFIRVHQILPHPQPTILIAIFQEHNVDIASLLHFSHSYMMENLERSVVSWATQHTKVEFMA